MCTGSSNTHTAPPSQTNVVNPDDDLVDLSGLFDDDLVDLSGLFDDDLVDLSGLFDDDLVDLSGLFDDDFSLPSSMKSYNHIEMEEEGEEVIPNEVKFKVSSDSDSVFWYSQVLIVSLCFDCTGFYLSIYLWDFCGSIF